MSRERLVAKLGTALQVEMTKTYGVNEWRDDLKRIIKDAGTGPSPVALILADSQVCQLHVVFVF